MEADTAVIVFLKAPEKGLVKTRLSKELGSDFVLDLYRGFVGDLLNTLSLVCNPQLFYWPQEKISLVRSMAGPAYRIVPQMGKDLGERMANAFKTVFDSGFNRALLIGTDIPEVTGKVVRDACERLLDHSAVIAPAGDGGYYLIGFTCQGFCRSVFQGIEWSTPTVWQQTLEKMASCSIFPAFLPKLDDIDTKKDLDALVLRVKNGKKIGRHTRSVLERYDHQ